MVLLYAFECPECGAEETLVRFGVSDQGSLIVYWRCVCGKSIKADIPLKQIINDIPVDDYDHQFLKGLKIRDD
jgi:transcription elongation factor Elf1